MHAAFCVSILVLIIPSIICEDECGSPHEIDRAQVSNPSDTGYVVGSTVTYKCDYGFTISGAVKTSRCISDPTTNEPVWTEPEFSCNPRSCGDPGFVENARRVGSRFTFPNNVDYVCNEGYKLYGPSRRYCEASGVWSGRLPSCRAITCERPQDPENGRAIYTSLTYDSELRYECNKDLQLSPKEQRFCGSDGKWTGTEPVCREIECEMPDKPEFGSMELVGNKPIVGSIVLFKCDPGRKLVGSGNSKCIKTGEWTFPAPLCVEPCVIPSIANGVLGKHEQEYKRYRWRSVFNTVNPGDILDENEEVTLKCDEKYVPKAQPLREITIICRNGQLSPEPECVSTTCNDDPPPIANGKAVVRNRQHEFVIWYNCDRGFEKDEDGEIKCVYGTWTGYTPTCKDARCDKSSLNYPGLARSEGFLYDKQSFVPTCLSGFETTEKSDKKIYCNSGTWSGNLPPCTKAQCRTEQLAGFNGLVLGPSSTLDDGYWYQPTCAEGFEFSNKLDSRIYCRVGSWQGNLPPCSPAHCSNNPPVPENGRIKSFRAIGHGSSVEYECFSPYEMVGQGNVICNHGKWTGSPPTCKDSRCYLKDLPEKDGIDLIDDSPVRSRQRATITCIKGYTLRYPQVYCRDGVWQTENLLSPCQEDDCEIKEIRNGEILEEKIVPVYGFFGTEVGKKTVRESADVGSFEVSGSDLYVECKRPYKFQGVGTEEQTRIICRRGEWTPLPVCSLPGSPLETELPKVGDEATVPISKVSKSNDSAIRKVGTNNSTIVKGEGLSSNNSVEDLDDDLVIFNNSSAEGEEAVVTDATVSPPCSCNYIIRDRVLQAHDGKKVVKYGDEILSGSIIAFYCNTTGFFRLKGPRSLMCPQDCNWSSDMFPSCVSPDEEDVIIRVFANPVENMQVGPGGVLSVLPGTRLELTCRAKGLYRKEVDWTTPTDNGFKNSEINRGVFRMQYTVPKATPSNSGKYTCFYGRIFHTVDIEVGDVECPEIEKPTEELGISYTPDRKFGSQATFHCFSPFMRKGPSSVTCKASGFWSGPPASCDLPTCPIESVYDVIPEGVVPLIYGEIVENLPFGFKQRLGCDEIGRVLKGSSIAECSTDGKWRVGKDLECIKGCGNLPKKNGSELLISPDKEFYTMGESVIFSCPEGKELTIEVQRILCFQGGWTPNTIPDCQ